MNESISRSIREFSLYACKIKETANGGWHSARREARETLEVIAQRRFARDVQIDEQTGAAQDGQDQAQKAADEKAPLGNWRSLTGRRDCCLILSALSLSPLSAGPR